MTQAKRVTQAKWVTQAKRMARVYEHIHEQQDVNSVQNSIFRKIESRRVAAVESLESTRCQRDSSCRPRIG